VNKHSAAVSAFQGTFRRGDEKEIQNRRKEVQTIVKTLDELSVDISTLKSGQKPIQIRGNDLYTSWISISLNMGELREDLIRLAQRTHLEHIAASYLKDPAEKNIAVCEKLLSKVKDTLSDDD
jgi:hypothetical protein